MSTLKLGGASTKGIARQILDNEPEFHSRFDEDSAVFKLIGRYKVAASREGGCRGCRKKRLLSWLDTELARLTDTNNTIGNSTS